MISSLLAVAASTALLAASPVAAQNSTDAPTVATLNGTYYGVHSEQYDQDFFLGMPFAQPPLGDLRWRLPKSLNETWDDERNATEYGWACVGAGGDSLYYPNNEDCLTLNVVRGGNVTEEDSLPVAIWIHGGGYTQGSSRDQRYNQSWIIQHATEIGKPFIGVSINYRLGGWGFLYSDEVLGSGNTNLGLRDQRLAFQWVQENIAAFGGDPTKVTLWGESAGALSIGHHLLAYNGRDDGLFSGAILESGSPLDAFALNGTAWYQPLYDELIDQANCTEEVDTLQCLREVPYDLLLPIINSTTGASFYPTIDGDYIQRWGTPQLEDASFIKVPLLIGTNTDEGAAFSPQGINTTAQFKQYLTSGASGFTLPPAVADHMLQVYPENTTEGIPAEFDFVPAPSFGAQWRRTAAYSGDRFFIAGRRVTAQSYATNGVPVYSYRWNAAPTNAPWYVGVTHFQEVAFVFLDFDGVGYQSGLPFTNASQALYDLAYQAAGAWASFIVDQDPNTGVDLPEEWPVFAPLNTTTAGDWNATLDVVGQNFVFDVNVTSFVEDDSWRWEGIRYMNSIRPLYKN